MAKADEFAFTPIACVGKPGLGHFKVTKDQLGWQCTGHDQVRWHGREVQRVEWQACGGDKHMLKLCIKGDMSFNRFVGFQGKDLQTLKSHFSKHFNVELQEIPVATQGHSWGDVKIAHDSSLRLMLGEQTSFELDIPELSQVSAVGRTELSLEFHEDAFAEPEDEVLSQIRFFVPDGVGTSVEQLKNELQRLAGLSAAGETLASFRDISMVAPRGKHNLDFYPRALTVHGKTQTYTIKYTSVARIFLLDMPSDRQKMLIVGLSQPLRSGNQSHPLLGMRIDAEAMVNTAGIVPEDAWKACAGLMVKRSDCLSSAQEPLYQVLGMLLKGFSGKPAVAPADEFKVKHPENLQSVRCAFRAENGHVFFLKKSMIFVPRPIMWLKYSDISTLELRKHPWRKNSFDMVVVKIAGSEIEFKHIDMCVFEAVFAFMEQNSDIGSKLVNKDVVSNSGVLEQHLMARQARTAHAKSKVDEVEDNTYDEGQDGDFEDGDDDSDDEDDDDDDDDESAEPTKKKLRNRT